MVRKGMRHELRSEIDDGIDRLYRIYAESVRNLGTPVFAKSYFRILREEFSTSSDIVTISSGGKAVASVLNFYFRDEVLPFYGGGIAAARQLAANDFMYWEVMRRACERGYRIFDFGRSKIGTGSYAFKCNWGFQADPARLSIPLGARALDAGFEPAQPETCRLYRGLETIAVNGGDPARPADRQGDRLTCRICLVAEALPRGKQAGETGAQRDGASFGSESATSRRFAGRARMATGAGLYRHCGPGLRHRIPARDQRGRPSLDRVRPLTITAF